MVAPPNSTRVAMELIYCPKPEPAITTGWPMGPDDGVTEAISGFVTTKEATESLTAASSYRRSTTSS